VGAFLFHFIRESRMADSSACSQLLVHCMDYRIQPVLIRWLEETGQLGATDILSISGSCRESKPVLETVKASVRLHNISRVILTQHEDCGAYGGHASFDTIEAERGKYQSDMKQVRDLIRQKFPDLRIETYLIREDSGNWKVTPFPVAGD
jgi:carbonic anhydrase